MRGVPPLSIPVDVIARDEYIRQQTGVARTAEQDEAFRRWNGGLALLGLAPPDLSPSQAADTSARWVGAFYSGADKAITIVDDGQPFDSVHAVGLLVHESMHAIQDAYFGLDALYQQYAPDRDRLMALSAVIEGEATYAGDRALIELFGTDPETVPWSRVFARWQERSRADALATPFPVTLSYLHFSYPFGTELVRGAITAEGWSGGAAALFASPPSGVREVLAGFRAVEPGGGPWAEELGADGVPVLPPQFSLTAVERMGAWIAGLFFERNGVPVATAATEGLRGDVLSVYHDENTGSPVAVWRLRFSSAELAATVAAGLREVGSSGPVRQLERDVILTAATDPASWLAIPSDFGFQPVPEASAALVAARSEAAGEVRCASRPTEEAFQAR